MAKKSVTAKNTDKIMGELVQRMAGLRIDTGAAKQAESAIKPEPEAARALEAFAHFDASMFSAWAAAVADLMASTDASGVGRRTIPYCADLICNLINAANELILAENAERRALA